MNDIKHITFYILVIIFIAICFLRPSVLENWVIYKQLPYGHLDTASEPVNFYIKPRYRKPYRYPFQFHKSYPVPHLSHLE